MVTNKKLPFATPEAELGEGGAPALKNIFDAARIRHIAREAQAVFPGFDGKRFVRDCQRGMDAMSLMQRMRHVAACLRPVLPDDWRAALAVLRDLGPRMDHGFAALSLSECVAMHGLDDFDASLDTLRVLTRFGSSEFAIRPFLARDLPRTLAAMRVWAGDAGDEHARRLASEGCRPRLPWAQRVPALVEDPELAAPILEALRTDPSAYVRKSVANHLNDITRGHPAWVLERLEGWPQDVPATRWIVKHALRTLIKQGDRRALALVGAGAEARVQLHGLAVHPVAVRLGEDITLSFSLASTAGEAQRLVVDYAVHYVKKSGTATPKVFKLKVLDLPAGATQRFSRRQAIRDFSTRTHHPGRHEVDVLVNGQALGRVFFDLRR